MGKKGNPFGLTDKQLRFCQEYCIDWNATRAAIAAGYSKTSARSVASETLTKPNVQEYISYVRNNLAETAGISALWVVNEYKKQVQHGITDVKDDWITEKEYQDLSEDVKSCIKKIERKVITRKASDGEDFEELEMLKLEFYDKQVALKAIREMLGFDQPKRQEISGPNGGAIQVSSLDLKNLSDKELNTLQSLLEKSDGNGG